MEFRSSLEGCDVGLKEPQKGNFDCDTAWQEGGFEVGEPLWEGGFDFVVVASKREEEDFEVEELDLSFDG